MNKEAYSDIHFHYFFENVCFMSFSVFILSMDFWAGILSRKIELILEFQRSIEALKAQMNLISHLIAMNSIQTLCWIKCG